MPWRCPSAVPAAIPSPLPPAQFNREEDGSLKLLPAKHVDTGMGLERITSILQGKMSNYATDAFTPIFDAIQRLSGAEPYTDRVGADDKGSKDMAYRVVADHIRTLSFAIADGARPGNEGRDYVLRRVLRRAVRYGRENLGAPAGFFSQLVDTFVDHMGSAYPELVKARETIREVIAEEEESFSRTLTKGIERFKAIADACDSKVISGDDAFLLWDTYGFPADLTQLMAEERGMSVDTAGFEAAMAQAKERSRAGAKKGGGGALKFEAEATGWLQAKGIPLTEDSHKYVQANVKARVAAILTKEGFVDACDDTDPVGIVLDCTSFYAEQGGQVADLGALVGPKGTLQVSDCQVAAGFVLHSGPLDGAVAVGEEVECRVDYDRRRRIMPNHTFTHILNFALREVLGDTVDQKGSIVKPDLLRFDFSHKKGMTVGECAQPSDFEPAVRPGRRISE